MLRLYTSANCPYCERVKTYMTEAEIDCEERNVTESTTYRDELLELGGKLQLPFLVDQNRSEHLYESEDIIEYLATHYAGKNA